MATAPKVLSPEEKTAQVEADKAKNKAILDKIKVDVVTPGEDDEKKKEVDEKKPEEVVEQVSEEENDAGDNKEQPEETIDENKDQIEEHEKKEEELEKEKAEASTKAEKDKIQKRIDREVAKRKALETENAQLKAQLAAKPDAALTEEEVEKRAEAKASEKDLIRQYVNTGNRLFDEASKLDTKFKDKVDDMADDIGNIPPVIIGILGDFKHGSYVLKALVDDHDLAEKYFQMAIQQPIKAAAELKEMELKLAPKPRAPSKVKVNEPVTNNGGNAQPARENMNQTMEEWVKTREARLRREGRY